MQKILDTTAFKNALLRATSQEPKQIWIASGYVKLAALKWLRDNTPARTEMTLIARFSPKDLVSGASDLSAVEYCLENNIKVGVHSRLHAKFYNFVGQKKCFLGSANLTVSGLGLSPDGNEEMSLAFEPLLIADVPETYEQQTTWVDKAMLTKMISHLDQQSFDEIDKIEPWPFIPKPEISRRFFSTEFPDILPSEIGIKTSIFLHAGVADFAKSIFLGSNVYQWILEEVEESGRKYTNFGWLTSKIHDALLDDPVPYRSGVKEICGLLFEWIEAFSDDLEIEQHTRTKSLRLKNIQAI